MKKNLSHCLIILSVDVIYYLLYTFVKYLEEVRYTVNNVNNVKKENKIKHTAYKNKFK